MNKKIISVLLVLSMLVGMLAMLPITIGAAETITITSVQDWMDRLSGKSVTGKDIVVTAKELDFTGKTVKPIKSFSGTFNGNGVVIKNLHMGSDVANSGENGIFGCPSKTEKATIKNFVITDSYFEGTKCYRCRQGRATKLRAIVEELSVEFGPRSGLTGGIYHHISVIGNMLSKTVHCVCNYLFDFGILLS